MKKVTAIIPAFNEEENIEKALDSVRWADEIIVADSFSNDRTLEIARKYNAVIRQREYNNSASQKNWIIPQASHEWIFLLDADEVCTEELKEEIQKVLSGKPSESAFWIYRSNYFMGRRIRYSGWQKDAVIRLFMRDNCRYQELHVHAEIETEGKVGRLKNRIEHYTYKGLDHYFRKFDRYTTWSARDRLKKTKKVTLFHLLVKPFFRFFKQYIIKLGILDGKVGFILCSMAAWSVFLRYLKAWRMLENEEL